MAKEDVVTGIDGLLKYLADKGETDISALSSAMGVSETTVHDWATVLEKAKLVNITYKLGRMYVGLLNASIPESPSPNAAPGSTSTVHYEKLSVEEIGKLNTVKSSILSDNIETQQRVVEKLEPQIRELRNYVEDTQKLFKNKSAEFKGYVSQLNALHAEASKSFESMGTYQKDLAALIQQMQKGPGTGPNQSDIVGSLEETAKNTQALIEDIRSKSALIGGSSDELLKAFDRKVEEERRKLVEFSDQAKAESKRLDRFAQGASDQLAQYRQQADAARIAFEKYIARASKEREAFIDRSTKAQDTLERLYSAAAKKFNEFDLMLSNELVEMGKVSELEQRLGRVKADVDAITQERDNLKKELDEFAKSLEAIEKGGKRKSPVESSKTIAEVEKKSKDYDSQVKGIKDKIEKADDEIKDISSLTKANKKQ